MVDSSTLCQTCHDGSGASTDLLDGVDGGGQGLRAGGFVYASMYTMLSGTITSRPVTSKHNVGDQGTIWGSGAAGSGLGPTLTVALECINCHDPHGSDSYRSLRPLPSGSSVTNTVTVLDESPPVYTVSYTSEHYRETSYATIEMGQ